MLRKIKRVVAGKKETDGAGVELTRVIGKPDVYDFDPFLMLDAFDHDDPGKYVKGFPWHPHRGIETVTYLIEGEVAHGDSLGNSGTITDGDCQWMTAGSGIIHQEMPQPQPKMLGVQLWVNLPSADKMTAPRYRDFTAADLPLVDNGDSAVRLIAGEFRGSKGPMEEITVRPTFIEVSLKAGGSFSFFSEPGDTLFIYIIRGSAVLEADDDRVIEPRRAVLFTEGDELRVKAGPEDLLFLLFAGQPLGEPIAWGGPIVMNTKEELAEAFRELEEGTFIRKDQGPGGVAAGDVHRDFYR